MTAKRALAALAVSIAAACSNAPAREVKEPEIYERPGIPDYEHISAVMSGHRLGVFYEHATAAKIEEYAGRVFAGQVDALAAELNRQAAASRVGSFVSRQMRAPVSSGGGGDCYSRKPPGFPDYVIDRESGGDPNATNGAHDGCAQIADSHFNGGTCTGLSYDSCWAKLWNGGAGASNWSQTL